MIFWWIFGGGVAGIILGWLACWWWRHGLEEDAYLDGWRDRDHIAALEDIPNVITHEPEDTIVRIARLQLRENDAHNATMTMLLERKTA